MTNAILRGKPDAGNPHVRFDEGEVASAKPRRGSLLYRGDSALRRIACMIILVWEAVFSVITASGVDFAAKLKMLGAEKKLVTQDEFLKMDKSKGVTLATKVLIYKGSFYDMGCDPSVWKWNGYACIFAETRDFSRTGWSAQRNISRLERMMVFDLCDCTVHAKSSRMIKDFNKKIDALDDQNNFVEVYIVIESENADNRKRVLTKSSYRDDLFYLGDLSTRKPAYWLKEIYLAKEFESVAKSLEPAVMRERSFVAASAQAKKHVRYEVVAEIQGIDRFWKNSLFLDKKNYYSVDMHDDSGSFSGFLMKDERGLKCIEALSNGKNIKRMSVLADVVFHFHPREKVNMVIIDDIKIRPDVGTADLASHDAASADKHDETTGFQVDSKMRRKISAAQDKLIAQSEFPQKKMLNYTNFAVKAVVCTKGVRFLGLQTSVLSKIPHKADGVVCFLASGSDVPKQFEMPWNEEQLGYLMCSDFFVYEKKPGVLKQFHQGLDRRGLKSDLIEVYVEVESDNVRGKKDLVDHSWRWSSLAGVEEDVQGGTVFRWKEAKDAVPAYWLKEIYLSDEFESVAGAKESSLIKGISLQAIADGERADFMVKKSPHRQKKGQFMVDVCAKLESKCRGWCGKFEKEFYGVSIKDAGKTFYGSFKNDQLGRTWFRELSGGKARDAVLTFHYHPFERLDGLFFHDDCVIIDDIKFK